MNEHVEHRMAKPTAVFRPNLSRMLKMFVIVLLSSQFFASAVAAQSVNVKLTLNNSTVADVIEKLHRQTGYEFSYDAGILSEKLTNVSVDAKNERIETVLSQVFGKSDITFRVLNNRVFLKSNKAPENIATVKTETAQQQGKTITGTIVDANGDYVVGATVVVQGDATKGTVTDINGNYILTGVPDNAILIVSYVGMKIQNIPLNGRTSINITLAEDSELLEEIVVVGYGTQKKVHLTGAVSTVDMVKEATSRPITNLSVGLAGLSSGLYVRSASNDPGSNAALQLRGQGTLNNSAPLIIVDGVESNINSVSPQDVANISVLKDAASSAIYGSRAANGVILITTRQGKAGKISIDYHGYYSGQSLPKRIPIVNKSYEYMQFINEAAGNSNLSKPYSDENIKKWKDAYEEGADPLIWPNSDWNDQFRTANTFNHSLSVSGGTDKVKSFLSVNYDRSPGIIENTGYDKISIRSNSQIQATSWLSLGMNLSGYISDKDRGSNNLSSLFTNSIIATPTVIHRSPDGRYGGTNNSEDNQAAASPLWYVNYYRGDNKTHFLASRFNLLMTPLKGLTVKGSYNYDFQVAKVTTIPSQIDRWNFQNNTILVSGQLGSNMSVSNSESRNARNFMDGTVEYENTVLDRLYFKVLVGGSQEQYVSESTGVSKLGLIDENLTQINAANGDASASGTLSDWAMRSYFGRFNFVWDDRYMFEANLRRDGSSRFLPQKRWGSFPSVSFGWRLSEEPFMKTWRESWLDNLKLRASYGSLGNNSVGNYDVYPVLSFGNYVLNNGLAAGFYQAAIANANLSWESTYVTNVGLDFSFFNKLAGSVDVYNKLTKDILIDLPAPYVHGNASIPKQNSAQVENKGIELTLGYNGQIGQDFSYSLSGNFTYNKNKVVKFKGDEYSLSGTNMIVEGKPINIQYVRKVDRIIQTQADLELVQKIIDNAPINETTQERINPFPYGVPQLGDFLYKDLNGDGIINDDDRETTGDGLNPKYMYGFSLGVNYKGFDFSVLFQGVAGLKEYYLADGYFTPVLRHSINVSREITDGRWYEGRTTPAKYPRLLMSDARNTKESDFWLSDKSYLKIRNIQLGYTLPQSILSKLEVSRLRLYVGLENFFTFTKYRGFDPEVSGVNYPTMKQVVGGINLSF